MRNWYLVYCKARQEDLAARGLEQQGYDVYLPKLRLHKRRNRGKVAIEEPLFPRYLFARPTESDQSIAPMQYTAGVAKLVRFGPVYLTVPNVVVTALSDREDPETGLHALTMPAMKAGDRVMIGGGVFKGFEGIFEARSGRDRVVVLLELLGRLTPTEVSIEELER